MSRRSLPALGLVLLAASSAAAWPRTGPGGPCYGGPPLRSHRRSSVDLRHGYGSRFGARGYYTPYLNIPAYGYGGFPGYAASPGFGYFPGFTGFGYANPFGYLAYSPTDAYLPYWNNAVGVSRFNVPWGANVDAGPTVVQLPPRVVTLQDQLGYDPRVTDGSARLERGGERYYLDTRGPAPLRERPATLNDTLRSKLRVETADTDQYLVRWSGDPTELAALELTALDADRKVVMRRLIEAAPFRGLLNTGGKTTMVTVSFDLKDGPTVTLEYPLERFQALAE
jgi:hypothetical protein